MEKRVKIGKTIIKALNETTITDTAIADAIGISRYAIHKWKTGKSESMRDVNLNSLAEVLGLQVIYSSDGHGELEPITLNVETKELNMSTTNGDVLVKTIDNLWAQIEKKDKALLRKDKIIADWKEKYENECGCNSEHVEHAPLLDLNKIQACISRKEAIFTDVTLKYAQLLGYSSRFELIGNSWLMVTPKEMQEAYLNAPEKEVGSTISYPEIELVKKDGKRVTVSANSYYPAKDINIIDVKVIKK